MPTTQNPFGSEAKLSTKAGDVRFYDLGKLEELGLCKLDKLPFSIKVLLESCLRNMDNFEVTEQDVTRLAKWSASRSLSCETSDRRAERLVEDWSS